jgi:hypothetical protein
VDDKFRRQDAYAGLLLCAVSLFVIVESWRMPRRLQDWPSYAGPGVVTGLLGLALLGLAASLLVRALRRAGAGLRISRLEARRYLAAPETARLVVMAGLCTAYLVFLGRGLPYALTTTGFLVVAMLAFRAAAWWVVLLVSAATALAIAVVFNRVFLIPLP